MALATTTVSGLISGLDTATIIQQLMTIERQPVNKLQAQVNLANQQKSAFTSINTALLALKTAADDLTRSDTWDAKSVKVSNEAVLDAAVTAATPVGAYAFTVTQLARASQLGTNGFATADTAVNPTGPDGSFDIQIGGVTKGTINVTTTDTLNTIAAAINAQDWGVTAVVVNSGEAGTPYKLVLTSDQTGTANAASIVNNVSTNLTFGNLTVAQNAQIQFGVDNPMTIESATNTITGLAPGLTLDLKSAAPLSPVTVTVGADSSGMLQKARDLVAKYNAVVDAITTSTKYDADRQVAAPLFGNSTLRFLSMDLANAIIDPVTGQPDETNSLAMIGFKLGTDGKLTLDEGVFSAALAAHPTDVTNLFSGIVSGTEVGVGHRVSHLLESVTTAAGGVIANEQSSLDTRISDLEKSIEDMNTRLDAKEERLRAEFTAMEMALAKMQQQSNYFLAQLNSLNSSK